MLPVRIGVIGCGAIAQVHHLPNLATLKDLFELTIVCDLSPSQAEYAAQKFNVQEHVTDYRQVLNAKNVDAVILCHTDPKTEVAVEAFNAKKHVFIEKPLCFSLQEADAIIAAANNSGTVGQVAYVKVYDPAFERAKLEVNTMDDIRFVQVNHLHTDNDLHLRQFNLKRFDDLPLEAIKHCQKTRRAAIQEAIGINVPNHVSRAFGTLSGSMIHDLYGLRIMLGQPVRIISTEIWLDGRGISTILEYSSGARCIATWVDLPKLWDFKETLEVYGSTKRVLLSYPTGFARGILSTLTIQEIDATGTASSRKPAIDWENPFSRELYYFHESIKKDLPNRTPITEARNDIALIIKIIKSYQSREPIS